MLGVWEGPAPPALTSNWHSETQISPLELVRAATMSRDNKDHGVGLTRETWVFILGRYNGTYTQARGH